VAIDLNCKSSPLTELGDLDALGIDDIIASKIVEGIVSVERTAPLWMLDATESMANMTITWEDDRNSGSVGLPEDFLRLVKFRMSDWNVGVTEAIDAESPLYIRQRSKYVCGNPERPVCAIVRNSTGHRLEFYSCSSKNATVAEALYRPYPVIDKNGGVYISTLCYKAVINYIAGLTLATVGETERAKELYEMSASILGE
jgi:hypothetical protein